MAKIRIVGDSSGYVELAAPNAAGNNTLELPSNATKIVGADANNTITVATGATIGSPATNVLTLGTNNVEVARFDSSGNLGIGLTNPSYAIDIFRTSSVGLRLKSTSGGANLALDSFSSAGVYSPQVTFIVDGSNKWAIGGANIGAASSTAFSLYNYTGATGNVFTVDTNNNFMIGSVNPTGTASQPLQVTGGAYISGNLGIGTVTPGENLHIFSSSGAIKIDSTGDAAVRWAQNGTNKFSLYQSGGTLRFYDNTNSAERVRLDSTGNLLLQTFSANFGLTNGVITGDGNTTIGSGGRQKFAFIANGYSTGAGLPHFIGNWASSGQWGAGPHSGSADNTIRIGPATYDSNGFYWNTGSQGGYANLAINSLYLRANTTTERNALSGISSGSLVYNSTRSSAELWNGTLWVRLHYPGDSADNYASSVTELVNAGLTGKDYFWMNTTDGGVQETFCDLDTADSSGGKGWMLVASMSDAAEWGRPGYSIRGRLPVYTPWNSEFNTGYEAGVTNWWSANWGNRNINYIRFTNTNDIFSHIGPGTWEGSDWYFYWSSAINYKQVWSWGSGTNKNYINDTSGTSDGNINASFHSGWPSPVNNGTATPRVCMRGFNSAYNIKLSYSVNQRWNNFADSGAGGTTQSWADWWSILTTPTYQYAYETSASINPNLYSVSGGSDGSVAILPSGSSSTTAAHDCEENNAKCGRDDDVPSASWSNTSTASVGQNSITDYRRSFYIWIK